MDFNQEPTWTPTDEELEAELRYWQHMDRIAEYDAWTEMRAELVDDELADLEEVA